MSEKDIVAVRHLVESLLQSGMAPDSGQLSQLSASIAKLFSVAPDEVAILALDQKQQSLGFVLPEQLAAVGAIPLSSTSALAARTARERKPQLTNSFPSMRHATVFEGVPLGRDSADVIQKILSAPILDGSSVIGVVQISRKGATAASAGPDFTPKDLQMLIALSPVLEKILKLGRKS